MSIEVGTYTGIAVGPMMNKEEIVLTSAMDVILAKDIRHCMFKSANTSDVRKLDAWLDLGEMKSNELKKNMQLDPLAVILVSDDCSRILVLTVKEVSQ
jgi:hypothetical protein